MFESRLEKSPSVEEALRRIMQPGAALSVQGPDHRERGAVVTLDPLPELTPEEFIAAAHAAEDTRGEPPYAAPVPAEADAAPSSDDVSELSPQIAASVAPQGQDPEDLIEPLRESGEEPLRRLATVAIAAEREAILSAARSEARLLLAEAQAHRRTILARAEAEAEIMVSRAEAQALTTVARAESQADLLSGQAPESQQDAGAVLRRKRKQR